MNKRGFTLIELLAVIVILGVIAAIAALNINKQITSSEVENKKILNQKIENAARIYAAKYYADKIVNCTEDFSFYLTDLENDGLLDLNGKCNTKKNEEIIYSCSSNEYQYYNIKDNDCYS